MYYTAAKPTQTYKELLSSVSRILSPKFSQKPQLGSSHPIVWHPCVSNGAANTRYRTRIYSLYSEERRGATGVEEVDRLKTFVVDVVNNRRSTCLKGKTAKIFIRHQQDLNLRPQRGTDIEWFIRICRRNHLAIVP